MQSVEAPLKMPDLPTLTTLPAPISAAPPQSHAGVGFQPGTRNLRRLLGYLTGGGFVLVALVLLMQNVAKEGLRPSDMLAAFESSFEVGVMKGKLPKAADGHEIVTQGDYEKEIARARAEGAAAVQFEYQKKLAAVQADQQRLVGAYTALYERTNMIAKAGVEMSSALQQAKQQMVASSEGGRSVVATYGDIFCALGAQDGCTAAQNARDNMVADMDAAQVDVGARIKALLSDVPDPASLVAGADLKSNGPPRLEK